MPSIGQKLKRGISSIGKKATSISSNIGQKIASVEKQAQKGINKGIDLGQGVLRQTERGIEAASGKIGSIKQGLLKGANIIDALQGSGIASMIPGLSGGLGAVSAGLKGGASGLKKLQDVGSDARLATGKAKNQLASVGQNVSGKVAQASSSAQARVEKIGERAKALETMAQEDLSDVRSAFSS